MTNNIFIGSGLKTRFCYLIYQELMKGNFVSNVDILSIHYDRGPNFYNKHSYSSEQGYGELKKAFPMVCKALELKYPHSIVYNNKRGKGKACKYVGKDKDPLAEERNATVHKSLEDYVNFCKASAGIMPATWFSSFFENTQLLLEANRMSEDGLEKIHSSSRQNLTNIHLLPILYKAITSQHVLQFEYQPFGHESYTLTFHPQYLKEYNGRWFVFGEADRIPYHAYNVPLDRIVGDIHFVEDIEYEPAPQGFYRDFFNDIVGVTHSKNSMPEDIIIRTKTAYQHGLVLTKPFHHSQKELLPFGEHDGVCYGEVKMHVKPNLELKGRILYYGENLEIIQPASLREEIKETLMKMTKQYE